MEKDLELRDIDSEYQEKQVDIWYIVGGQLKKDRGWIVFEMDPTIRYNPDTGTSERRVVAKYVPEVFHKNYVSDKITETIKNPYPTSRSANTIEIPKRGYLGFGRYVANQPGVPFMGTIWNDGMYTDREIALIYIHHLEDYMLDGYLTIEELESLIAQLGEELD